MPPTKQVFADHCRELCAEHHWELLPTGILVTWENGRKQLIGLEFFEFEREELVRLSTMIGDVEQLTREQLVRALESNAELAHGALAIMGNQLCMIDTLMLQVSARAEIEAAIEFIARVADDWEKALFDTDEY